MKNDRYLKIILTIIAICLVWICVRDINVGGKNVFASSSADGQAEVEVWFSPRTRNNMEEAFFNALQRSSL